MDSIAPVFDRALPLDPDLSANARISVSANSAPDVLAAIAHNQPLPARELSFGDLDIRASLGAVTLSAGPGKVAFQAGAGVHSGVAVCNSARSAIASLKLQDPPLALELPAASSDRFLCQVFQYNASGEFTGAQPIGAVGTVTFGAKGAASGLLAVIHRFPADTGADTVLARAVPCIRLPRHVRKPDDLAPGTWVIGESDGSVALNVAAGLGYDFHYVRKDALGVGRNLGARIDASAKATFGFSVSGRYLVAVGRPDASTNVRLQIFKQKQHGLEIGLNAQVGVTPELNLPGHPDDFVKSVCGVHGLQVLKELRAWTDPGQAAAGLLLGEAKDLLRHATGRDPDADLAAAHKEFADAVAKFESLPERVAASLWRILDSDDPQATAELKSSVAELASTDPDQTRRAFDRVLSGAAFGNSPGGQFLSALATHGLLPLRESAHIGEVQKAAAQVLGILNDGVIANIQKFIGNRLDLQKLIDATAPAEIDEWLRNRLAAFLDAKVFDSEALQHARAAVESLRKDAADLYAKAVKAATNRYSAEFAATYQRTVAGEALADAVFDLAQPAATELFAAIMDSGSLDKLFTTPAAGVSINQASLTHEIKRQAIVEVHLPFFDSKTEHINDSIAKLTFEHDSGRVLVYQLDAKDTVRKQRFLSQMQIFGRIAGGAVAPDSTVSYQMLVAEQRMDAAELRHRTAPFIGEYLPAALPFAAMDAFYRGLQLDGAVLLNMQVGLPAAVLAAWLQPKAENPVPAMSCALQRRLRRIVPLFYFQDPAHRAAVAPAAALLTWAALPVATSAAFDAGEGRLTLHTDREAYWDWPDIELREAMARCSRTAENLVPLLAALGIDAAPAEIQRIAIANQVAMADLHSLCFVEAVLVHGAADAFRAIQKAASTLTADPSVAIEALADAGAKLAEAFHRSLSGVYGGRNDPSRALNGLLLVEAARALGGAAVAPSAMLNVTVLKPASAFPLAAFTTGDLPPQTDVASAQSIVN